MANIESTPLIMKPYPGRIVITALGDDGEFYRQYCVMQGRSTRSRNRIYVVEDGIAWTEIFDKTMDMGDDLSDIIYTAMSAGSYINVASNGRQTDSIWHSMNTGDSLNNAQSAWENEGPKADHTSRITTVINTDLLPVVLFGRISRNPLNFERSIRTVYEAELVPGYGFYIATYNGEGGTEPSREEPLPLRLSGTLEDSMDFIWRILDESNRVALVGREINQETGEVRYAPPKNARLGD